MQVLTCCEVGPVPCSGGVWTQMMIVTSGCFLLLRCDGASPETEVTSGSGPVVTSQCVTSGGLSVSPTPDTLPLSLPLIATVQNQQNMTDQVKYYYRLQIHSIEPAAFGFTFLCFK